MFRMKKNGGYIDLNRTFYQNIPRHQSVQKFGVYVHHLPMKYKGCASLSSLSNSRHLLNPVNIPSHKG